MEDNFFLFGFLAYCTIVYISYLRQGWRQSVLAVLSASIWVAHLPPSSGIVKYFYLLVLVLGFFATQRGKSSNLKQDLAFFVYLIGCLLWLLVFVGIGSPEFDSLYKVSLLAPLSIVVGYQAAHSGSSHAFFKAFKVQGIAFSALALIEFFTSRNWVPQRANEFIYNNADGRVRLFSEHPLVLALLLTTTAYLILNSAQDNWKKLPTISLVFAASLTTQAISAPVLIAALAFVAVISNRFNISVQASFRFTSIFVATFFFVLIAVSSTLNPFSALLDTPGDIASALYRYVIYGLMWVILANFPLGLGPLGLPDGIYTIPSVYGDLNPASLDSELVYSVSQFGFIGFVPYVLVFGSLFFLRHATPARSLMLVLLLSSLFASIHSWISLTILFFFTLGASAQGSKHISYERDIR